MCCLSLILILLKRKKFKKDFFVCVSNKICSKWWHASFLIWAGVLIVFISIQFVRCSVRRRRTLYILIFIVCTTTCSLWMWCVNNGNTIKKSFFYDEFTQWIVQTWNICQPLYLAQSSDAVASCCVCLTCLSMGTHHSNVRTEK